MTSQTSTPPDPGMAVKMAPPGIPDLPELLAGRAIDEAAVAGLIEFVDARNDCADFRMITLLTIWLHGRAALSPRISAEVKRAILAFGYWMDEPGTDAMCTWSENHQVILSACEYIAGQTFPDEVFASSGFTGRDRMARARSRLDRWLADRFRFGYTEWASTTYYEEHAAGLGLLTEHCRDEQLAARATVALDLLFLDLALYSFRGRLVATSGRAYEVQKKYPEQADVDQLLAWGFPAARAGLPEAPIDYSRISGPLLSGTQYRVPEAIRAIPEQPPAVPVELRTSTGLDVAEVKHHYPRPLRIDDAGMQLWAMEAFTNPESINLTAQTIEHHGMADNAFLQGLGPFVRLRRTGILPGLIRLLNPATQGVAIQRANITTWRSPDAQLSSVQHHHPGQFGDQQHLWTLALPGDVAIFAVHPGAPMFDSNQRGFSPAEWVGNGINPAIGQAGNLLLACYDTRALPGLLEHRPRQRLSHLFVPFDRLDEAELEHARLWVRSGSGCALILADGPIVRLGDELVRHGRVTGWAVVVGEQAHDSLTAFRQRLPGYSVRLNGGRLQLDDASGQTWAVDRHGFSCHGVRQDPDHPRFDTPWVRADRCPTRIEVHAAGHRLLLTSTGGRDRTEDQP